MKWAGAREASLAFSQALVLAERLQLSESLAVVWPEFVLNQQHFVPFTEEEIRGVCTR